MKLATYLNNPNEYVQVPCNCRECLLNPAKGLVHKAKYKIGDVVHLTLNGKTAVNDNEVCICNLNELLTIRSIDSNDYGILYKVDNVEFYFHEDEIKKVEA